MQADKTAALPRGWGLWIGLRMLWRFIWPDPRQRTTIRAIFLHGGLNRGFYRRTYGHLHWWFRLFCVHHYAVWGEAAGLQPNAEFSPNDYLRQNPDVAQAGVSPLWHWLTLGRNECRLIRVPQIQTEPNDCAAWKLRPRHRLSKACFAVCVHAYYPEIWPELRGHLSGISLDFDLYVTVPDGEEALRLDILGHFPKAELFTLPNRGRDILPFLTLTRLGVFDGYEAVLKLHTKRSPHRPDGDQWRRRLVRGVLPNDLPDQLQKFLARKNAATWVADGQVLNTRDWWGENFGRTREILGRVELPVDEGDCPFPAGSIYWIKPFALGLLRSLRLGPDDFEPEIGKLDGTTAHSVERVLGQLVQASGQQVVETAELSRAGAEPSKPRYVSAFYLPQFHQIPENDAWWGDGYTEWRAVDGGKPLFRDHLQPYLPIQRYDLTDPAVMERQALKAQSAGIDAFCVYFYWFNGRRLLEQPLDNLLKHPDVDFPYYLCWANESWRRNWDGQSGEELVRQIYLPGFEEKLARDLLPYFHDPRYQRPDGERLRFVIYRPHDLPDAAVTVERLRVAWFNLGVGEVEIGAVLVDPMKSAPDPFDFWVEMPPHGLCRKPEDVGGLVAPEGLAAGFEGIVYDYARLAERSFAPGYLDGLPHNTIRGIMPSWDNTARRGLQAHIARGGNPAAFRRWLERLCTESLPESYRQELFVNAWNEWGEKAVLEPSERFGRLNLIALSEFTGKT